MTGGNVTDDRKNIERMIAAMKTKRQFMPERVFFAKALSRTMRKLRIQADEREKMRVYSQLCWGRRSVFPDTRKALRELRKTYQVVVASNSDTEPLLRRICLS